MGLEPTDAEILTDAMESKLLDVHTCCVARVEKYDAPTQTADVQPVNRRAVELADGSFDQEDLPVIPNVKVKWPRAGGFSLHFPLKKGDHVVLVFSEADLSSWRTKGGINDTEDVRRHHLSDAIAIPGISIDSDPIPSDDAPAYPDVGDAVAVLNGAGIIRLGDLAAAQFVALSNLVDARLETMRNFINTHVHPTGVGPSDHVATPLAALDSVAGTKVKAE